MNYYDKLGHAFANVKKRHSPFIPFRLSTCDALTLFLPQTRTDNCGTKSKTYLAQSHEVTKSRSHEEGQGQKRNIRVVDQKWNNGYKIFFGGLLYSLFSASKYDDRKKFDPKILQLSLGKAPKILAVDSLLDQEE